MGNLYINIQQKLSEIKHLFTGNIPVSYTHLDVYKRQVLYVFMWAVAAALINPRKDALLQLNINPQERARINALIMASTIALASPFGYFSGWLSSLDRRLPFIFMFLLFVAAMVIIGRIQEPEFDKNSGNADQRLDS